MIGKTLQMHQMAAAALAAGQTVRVITNRSAPPPDFSTLMFEPPALKPHSPFIGKYHPQARTRRFMRGATVHVIPDKRTARKTDPRLGHSAAARAFRRADLKRRKAELKEFGHQHGVHPPMRRADGAVR